MDLKKKYYAKLMLAGEYGIIAGSDAITVPYRSFFARLAKRDSKTPDQSIINSVASLRKLMIYIKSLPRNSFFATPETGKLNQMLKEGYYIESSIPQGYGIGSSGAVSALVYDQFFKPAQAITLQQQKKDLATLESCFHGKSSGVDAMTCYANTPLHFMPDGDIRCLEKNPLQPPGDYRFFLVDSGQVFATAPLVSHFLEMMKDDGFQTTIRKDYFSLINKFIRAIDGSSGHDPALIFRAISDLQWNHFRKMIPQNMEDAWINGQVSNAYYLKLNGSGGGYMLGIAAANSTSLVEEMLPGQKITWI